jgi:hypothetical protein
MITVLAFAKVVLGLAYPVGFDFETHQLPPMKMSLLATAQEMKSLVC